MTSSQDAPTDPSADAPGLDEAREVLRSRWGYEAFRPGQEEAIASVLSGRDTLAILPTGGGKSLCYQVPALVHEGLTLVISPLIALMEDQVASLQARGIPAAFINSTLPYHEVDQRFTDAEFGRYRLLYMAPERLESDLFLNRAERLPVSLLAVDEAHCISEWGTHFRPAYQVIPEARMLLGEPPALAVTATATPQVRRDIVEMLELHDPTVLVRGFDRPNIVWSIFHTENKRRNVSDVLRGVQGSGIVYAATRRGVEQWRDWIAREGETVAAYHGGLSAEDRVAAQRDWIEGDTRVMVATNAFGMGIDKPDVRFVIHADLASTLEGYYQEAGRAGRDGERAYAVLLVRPHDEDVHRTLIEEGHPTAADAQRVYQAVCNLGQVPLGAEPDGPLTVDLEKVARVAEVGRGKVRAAMDLLERHEVWQALPQRPNRGYVRFSQPANALRKHAADLENRKLGAFIDSVLRAVHADAFSGWWDIDLRLLERRTGLDRPRLLRGMAFLQERGLLDWRPPDRAQQLILARPRTQSVPLDDLAVRRARRRAEQRLDDMLRYARSITCRRRFLLTYFGESSPERCGRCDVCLGRHDLPTITPDDEPMLRSILQEVAAGDARRERPGTRSERRDVLVDWLIQEGYLRMPGLLDEQLELTEKGHDWLEQWQPRS